MWFIMINESFVCEKCNKKVVSHKTWSARNHCPFCLYSKHLDKEFPWDRKSECFWLMKPVDIDYRRNKGYMIKHICLICEKTILNKVAEDDDFLEFVKKRNKEI